MHLARFPRVKLCHAPTPLEFMPRLTKALSDEIGGNGPQLWIKRDDCTGLATGGNKNRKLEFLLGEAIAQGATHIVTQGAVQSNHVRQTAAACAKLGLKCTALLEHRVVTNDSDYNDNGNVLLDRMMGLNIEYRPGGTDMNGELAGVGERLKAEGEVPYLIPGGGSNTVGALGYAHVALETMTQANEMGLRIDLFVHATGSAGTQAGLVVGFEALNSGIPVLGIGVRNPRDRQEAAVHALADKTAKEKLGLPGIRREAVQANCDYVGAGYGIPTDGMIEAVTMFAQLEGLFLDPVYSGKGAAGLIDLVRKRTWTKDQNIVFLHTGGQVGLFAYRTALTPAA